MSMPITLPAEFDERAARVARLELPVDLNQPGELLVGVREIVGCAVIDWFSPATLPPAALGVPPTPPALPIVTTVWPTRTVDRVSERHGREARGVLELEHGDVVARVVAHDVRGVGAAVADVGRGDLRRLGDDVVVGQDLAVGADHHAGAGRLAAVVAGGDLRDDVDDARIDSLRDRRRRRRGPAAGPGLEAGELAKRRVRSARRGRAGPGDVRDRRTGHGGDHRDEQADDDRTLDRARGRLASRRLIGRRGRRRVKWIGHVTKSSSSTLARPQRGLWRR